MVRIGNTGGTGMGLSDVGITLTDNIVANARSYGIVRFAKMLLFALSLRGYNIYTN